MKNFKFTNGVLSKLVNGACALVAHTPLHIKTLDQAIAWFNEDVNNDDLAALCYESQELAYLQAEE